MGGENKVEGTRRERGGGRKGREGERVREREERWEEGEEEIGESGERNMTPSSKSTNLHPRRLSLWLNVILSDFRLESLPSASTT